MHFAYQPPITPHRVCGDPLTGDRRKTLLTAWRSGLSSGVIFPHRASAPRFHRPRLAIAIVEGSTLTELIARRDVLSLQAESYRRLVEEAGQNTHRATRTEIKILPAVDVPALQRQADEASRALRLLDNTLQATNWTSDLLE